MHTHTLTFRGLGLLAAVTIFMTGCASTTPEDLPANVAERLQDNPELSTFAHLLQQAGMASKLRGDGPVTVFAPTNAAFEALPSAQMDKLAKDPQWLKAVMRNHVAPGLRQTPDWRGSEEIQTSGGAVLVLAKVSGYVTAGDALVTQADLPAGNGVVQVIDRVLLPVKR